MMKKKRIQFLLAVVAIAGLSSTAEKCRSIVGKEAASKSGEFNFMSCLDGSTGSIACIVKEGMKLYVYSIRTSHVERAKSLAMEGAMADTVSQGMTAKDATKEAQKAVSRAAKMATRQVDRVLGPIVSSGWDLFEAFYFGGTITEGSLRSSGTMIGTYLVGFLGEQSFGKRGYFIGSMLGSWIGGKVGLMVYDLVNGVEYVLRVLQLKKPDEPNAASSYEQVHEEF